ncbi:MAG: type II toxin-antitoxin system VapC family toxin [Capsulimonadaceae bacterium]
MIDVCLLDTNILLRLVSSTDPDRPLAEAAILNLTANGIVLAVCPQNIVETRVVLTRPIAQNGFGMTAPEALAEIVRILITFALIPETTAVFPTWRSLVEAFGVLGKPNHDARILAAARVSGCSILLTFNVDDFARYAGTVPVKVMHPAEASTLPH